MKTAFFISNSMLARARAVVLVGLGGAAAVAAPLPEFAPGAAVADLGRLTMGENRVHRFVYTNTAPATVHVRAIETSCDCLTVLDYPRELAAGAVGRLSVNVFAEKPGDFAFAAVMEMEDGGQRFFMTLTTVVPADPAAAVPPPLAPRRVAAAWRPGTPRPIDPEVLQRVVRTRDRSLYRVLDDDMMQAVRDQAWRVVDLRGEADYAAQTIPGALNIPAAAVPSKAFLRHGPVLLVDEGWGGPAAERACRLLREAGNGACAVLLGGMAAWARQGGELAGAARSPDALQSLTAREFLGVRGYDDWVVVQASGAAGAVAHLLHEAVPVADVRPDPWQRVLLLDDAPPPASAVAWGAVSFRLRGGLAALEREFRDMTAMRHSREQTTVQRVAGRQWEILKSGCGCK